MLENGFCFLIYCGSINLINQPPPPSPSTLCWKAGLVLTHTNTPTHNYIMYLIYMYTCTRRANTHIHIYIYFVDFRACCSIGRLESDVARILPSHTATGTGSV